MVNLSKWQRLVLRLRGFVKVGEVKMLKGNVPLYTFRCELHGLQRGTAQGHKRELRCPDCYRSHLNPDRVNPVKVKLYATMS